MPSCIAISIFLLLVTGLQTEASPLIDDFFSIVCKEEIPPYEEAPEACEPAGKIIDDVSNIEVAAEFSEILNSISTLNSADGENEERRMERMVTSRRARSILSQNENCSPWVDCTATKERSLCEGEKDGLNSEVGFAVQWKSEGGGNVTAISLTGIEGNPFRFVPGLVGKSAFDSYIGEPFGVPITIVTVRFVTEVYSRLVPMPTAV